MERVFSAEDQLSFAALSGDFNPMHVDPIAARRLMFGRPVVHGIHAVLWALDGFLAGRESAGGTPLCIRSLSAEFRSPMLVDDKIALEIIAENTGLTRLELTSNAASTATIELLLEPADRTTHSVEMANTLPQRLPCREVSPVEAKNAAGKLPLHLKIEAAAALFPTLTRLLLPAQFAALLATTRLVGMELPGLHSIYTGFELTASDDLKQPVLEYAVEASNQRLAMLLNIAVKSPGFSGKVSAAFRPAPTQQSAFNQFRQFVDPTEFQGQRALVIGGSRGLGEVAVKALAAGGADVRFTFFKGASDSERIVSEIKESGPTVSCFAFDAQSDAKKLPELLGSWQPTLLCYFATPTISSTAPNHFQRGRFYDFCAVYVDAFIDTFHAVKGELRGVLYPSSSAIDELPSNMGEYAAAKVAAENMCEFLAKTNPAVKFHTPRFGRLATDQTATVMAVATGDANKVVLESLRHTLSIKAIARKPVETGPVIAKAAGPAFVIAATFTSEPIEPFVKFWMSELGQTGSVEFAQYNQVFQSLLDPAGIMSRKNFANAVLIRFEDWIEGDKSDFTPAVWKQRLQPVIAELITAVSTISRPAPTMVLVCPPSTKAVASSGVGAVLDELAAELIGSLKTIPGVLGFTPADVSSLYPAADYYSASGDAVAKIPFTSKYFAALGTFLARNALAVRRSPFKVIVLDCDNTLWSGVCGEGGVAAVAVGSGHRAMQEFMANQSAMGKILCLCSKNSEPDVWDIFDHHPGMVLKRSQIVGHRINWSAKSANLRELARDLNVGLDSFIFIDDNPVECAEVRANCPQVLTLQPPAREEDWPRFLKNVWAFDQLTVTDQDLKRAASYQQNAQREAVRKESAGLDDFLAKLNLQVDIAPPNAEKMARVAQLTERTNQFNFSTIRRSEAEIIALLKNPQYKCNAVEVKDRFGDYGLVGVVITRADAGVFLVDTMLLSCRVLGRGVEHRMLASIGGGAKSLGIAEIEIPFVRTEKNQPALDFLNGIARDYRSDTKDGFVYRIPAEIAAEAKANVISSAPVETENESIVDSGKPAKFDIPYQRIAETLTDADAILATVNPPAEGKKDSAALKTIVAELLGIAPGQLTSDRLLSGARLPGSLGRAILDASLRERLGLECPACYTAKTFGDLEAALAGTSSVASTPGLVRDQTQGASTAGRSDPTLNLPVPIAPAILRSPGPGTTGCGIDMELVANLPITADFQTHEFYNTHFTPAEIAYCAARQNPLEHFAARWSAKEAIKKCEPSLMAEQMKNIEVVSSPGGAPSLRHHRNGSVVDLPHALSLSHTNIAAVAVVARLPTQVIEIIPPQTQSKVIPPRAGWLQRWKQKIVRRIAYEVLNQQETSKRVAMESQVTLDSGAVILPEALIENLSGNKATITIGEHSIIRGRLLTYPHSGTIKLGSWCYIGGRTEIWAMADMKIGDRVQISHNVTILDSSSHSRNAAERHAHFRAISTMGHPSTWDQLPGVSASAIVIEDDVWIGAGVIVLPGVRIGARSIVNAGSVVSADIPPDTIYWSEMKPGLIPNYT